MASDVITNNMVKRYDMIPEKYLNGTILELGAGDNSVQLCSKHRQYFESNNYLGIDLYPPKNSSLNIIYGDIQTISFEKDSFDLIISFEVFEHIEYKHWNTIFDKIKLWLKPNGLFTFSTPYNESCREYDCISPHAVFGIKESTFTFFFSNLSTKTLSYDNLWGIPGEFSLKRVLRGIKRILTNHEYVKNNLYCQWRKEST